ARVVDVDLLRVPLALVRDVVPGAGDAGEERRVVVVAEQRLPGGRSAVLLRRRLAEALLEMGERGERVLAVVDDLLERLRARRDVVVEGDRFEPLSRLVQ